MTIEHDRLQNDGAAWRRWGPYLSERGWGTVREDYSADGNAWSYLPHDHARSRVYRWNEDGLGGISDDKGRICFALALWNGHDPILKERLFGLGGPEGNHGEDVKEYYFYLDSTPTHSYMRMLYKYPQAAYPYADLVAESARRTKADAEFELLDTGVFDNNRYFDVFIEYAKAAPDDMLIRISAVNRGPEAADLQILPTLWFRNTWDWGYDDRRPTLDAVAGPRVGVHAQHWILGEYTLWCHEANGVTPHLLFTENATNTQRLFNTPLATPYVKDAFHRYVIESDHAAVNPQQHGTKAAACYPLTIAAGATATVCLRFTAATKPMSSPAAAAQSSGVPADNKAAAPATAELDEPPTARHDLAAPETKAATPSDPFADFDTVFVQRIAEADDFYATTLPDGTNADLQHIHRQALAGLLWCKQFYHYVVAQWLDGDPSQPPPPPERQHGRNHEWRNIYNERVMSMPDAWEYPWYAAWDLAFHCLPLALIDPGFAKSQLDVIVREWFQHPNGQLPAYEWAFGDVNPPVLAWAAWRVYKIEQKHHGVSDRQFLERVFHKMLLCFTWWVNRKDAEGNNVFEGGFLGLDNIGVFDRSAPLPTGGHLEQSDGTSWMGTFCLNMLTIALELALTNPVYEAIATKFFEHFLAIADAMNDIGEKGIPLWNEEDQFFYDVLHLPNGQDIPLRVRSFVGLIPLFAVKTIEPATLAQLPEFRARMEWYLTNRPDLAALVSRWDEPGAGERRLLALCRGHRMKRLLARALDPAEFLSDHGVRALSRYHKDHPYRIAFNGQDYSVEYEPAESRSGMFGGNSNWRGPVWFPVNYLLIEAIQRYHHYYGDEFKVECPTGSGQFLTLNQIADELSQRLITLFTRDSNGRRVVFGDEERFQTDPNWRDYVLFYEYFHGDTGQGLGASHQTGWTGLVAKLIQQQCDAEHEDAEMAGTVASEL